MDKKKLSKEEKVGSDGLTKKERRALKVQAKQTDDNKAELRINQKNKIQEEGSPEVKVKENICALGEAALSSSEKNDSLSEKQKRKLEWERKQKEQGNQINKGEKEDLSKAELRAKRREIQEVQRQAKIKAEAEKNKGSPKKKADENKVKDEQLTSKNDSLSRIPNSSVQESKNINLFNHLLASRFESNEEAYPAVVPDIHPAFINFGILYSTGDVLGSNDKTAKFLSAIKNLIYNLIVPPGEEFCRYLEVVLDKCVYFLQKRKHVSFSMLNSLKAFKVFLTQLDKTLSDDEKKESLSEYIDTYIQEQIITAGIAISLRVEEKISNNDEILVYGWSPVIFNILVETYKEHKKDFSVVIVDSRPSFEGDEMLKNISAVGIKHKYVMLHALSHVMPFVNTVLLEADALLTNGYLISKAGTAQIAMMAQAHSKPVLVCCETYKFTERVQTDGMMCNELGKLDLLLENRKHLNPVPKEEKSKPTLFNLLYDVTPSDLVTAVLTELAILPSSSVPVVLRIKPQEL
ncbi:translation initiation factor eIF-2B subunit delta [Harmonia axyridis]|uniref:translation initiation factor eIF-2B subunit delta n=1 Tax=Harmonia axyridis TaxID=115357 RepID=UPI001E278888|nr:translation initiation factor eIF-2B subunit delta [Harmonia axyridis]